VDAEVRTLNHNLPDDSASNLVQDWSSPLQELPVLSRSMRSLTARSRLMTSVQPSRYWTAHRETVDSMIEDSVMQRADAS
jgi:hypothetical protein